MIKKPSEEILRYIRETYSYNQEYGGIDGPLKQNIGALDKRNDGKLIRRIKIQGKNYKVHHIVWYLCMGWWPTKEIDHIDRDTLNNKIDNLDEVTKREQLANRSKSKMYKGFSIEEKKDKFRPNPWIARNHALKIHLGHHKNKESAEKAVDAYIEKYGKWWV